MADQTDIVNPSGAASPNLVKDPPAPSANPYPRFLNLAPWVEEALKTYLDQEVQDHNAERVRFHDDIIRWQKDYIATPPEGEKTFPFKGAAKLVIPLTAIAVEAVHSRTMTTLFGLKQLVSVKAKKDEWDDASGPVEKCLEGELKQSKFRTSIEPSVLEIEKLGTGVGRAGWNQLVKYGVTNVGGREVEFPVTVKRGAEVYSVPLARFIMPFSATDPQTAPWCGEEIEDTQHTLYLKEQSGLLPPGTYARMYNWVQTSNTTSRVTQNQEELDKRVTAWPQKIIWQMIWMAYDVDGSGTLKEIVVYYHYESRTLLGARYNWYRDLRRPYRKGVYFPVEHRWTGLGICKQNEQFQEEVTTQHRQRIDNATLANMRMFKVSRLSGYGPKEPVFPGKMWFVDDMSHIDTVQMAEVYPSSYNNENQAVLYSQQRTGVNEVTLGMPQVGTPGTATGDLARVQEGRRKFDYVYNNIKVFANELITDFAAEMHQFGPRRIEYVDEGARKFFTLPDEAITEGLIFDIGLAGEQENKIVDRNNWTQVAGLLTQYYTNMLELAERLGDFALMQKISRSAMVAATEAMKQIADSFDLRNTDRIVMMELLNNPDMVFANGIPTAGPTGLIAPGNGGTGGIAQIPSVSSAPQAINGASAGISPEVAQLLSTLRGLRA